MRFAKTLIQLTALALAASFCAFGEQDIPSRVKYRIGPGDVITVSVVGIEGFDSVCRVSNSGKIHLPHVGVLSVDSLALEELEQQVAEEYKKRNLLRDPVITVEVNQSRAQPVYILGEVMMPGQFIINERMFVLDLLTLSGGANEVASNIGYLYRRRQDQSKSAEAANEPGAEIVESTMDEAIPINFDRVFEGTEEAGNLELQAGDVLYVPVQRKEYFYVVGDVYGPGQQELPFGEKVSATRAIGMASGPTKTAKLRKGILAWKTEDGGFEHRPVDLRAILDGKEPDFYLNPGDILFVPGSAAKSLAMGMLNAVPGFALQ